jgi:hypothetical protein
MRTNVEGLFLANTTQIINSNLNNNAMVKIANRAVQLVSQDCLKVPSAAHLPSEASAPCEFLPQ